MRIGDKGCGGARYAGSRHQGTSCCRGRRRVRDGAFSPVLRIGPQDRLLTVVDHDVEVVADEGGCGCVGASQVRHFEVAYPGVSVVEGNERRSCC